MDPCGPFYALSVESGYGFSTSCGKLGRKKYYCSEHEDHGPFYTLWRDNNTHHCPTCAFIYLNKQVGKTNLLFSAISSKFRQKLFFREITFTIPHELLDDIEADSDYIKQIRKAILNILKKYMEEKMGGFIAYHSHSSSKPWLFHPHFHVVIPNVIFDPLLGTPRIIRYKIPKYLLEKIKTEYKKALTKIFKKEIKKVVVQYQFSNLSKMLNHGTCYYFRLHIFDILKGLQGYDLNEKVIYWDYYDKMEREKVSMAVPLNVFKEAFYACESEKHNKRIIWFGFLADGVKKKYLKKLGLTAQDLYLLDDNEEEKALACPICGAPLEESTENEYIFCYNLDDVPLENIIDFNKFDYG